MSIRKYKQHELGYMRNDDLKNLYLSVRSGLHRAKSSRDRRRAKQCEIELCYIQREIEIRNKISNNSIFIP